MVLRDVTERVEVEQALRRFELIATETRDVVLFMRREDGRIVEANAAAQAAYGYGREELLSLAIGALRAQGTAELTAGQMAAADAEGILFETVHRRKDGSTFPVEVSSRGATVGGTRMLVSVIRDITDRKRAEDALRRSEARLQAIVEGLAEGLIVSTADGRLVHWNRAALEMHGFASVEEVRRHLSAFEAIYSLATLDGRELPLSEWPMARVLRGERVHECELVLRRRADGWTRTFSYGGSIVHDADGQPTAVLTVTDVTERRAGEARLRVLAEALPQLVWTADASGRLDYFNQRWRDYTGQAEGEEAWEPALHPEDRARIVAAWREAVEQQRANELEHRLRGAGGGFRWFLRRAFPLRSADGASCRWFGTCTDIHELKESQALLRQADRLKEDFLSMAGHELRTPLTTLRLQADLLRRSLRKAQVADPRAEHRLSVMDAQIDRLKGLIGILLDVSRIIEGRLTLELAPTDLADVAREVVERFAVEAESAGVEVQLRARSVPGRWDRERLDQVVTNLLSNAIKYGRGRPVDVEVDEQDGAALLRVRDRGIGVPPDCQARIFERFERGSNTGLVKGLGLGLWIARTMVTAHGGAIRVESTVGEGSTFVVSLPRTPAGTEQG